jgi:DNA-binding XRE family transcriptional regulator
MGGRQGFFGRKFEHPDTPLRQMVSSVTNGVMSYAPSQRSNVPEWTLGDRLAKSRRHIGMQRDEMADYLGVSAPTVSNYENDKREPSLHVVTKWAVRCGVDFAWLATGDTAAGGGRPGPGRPRRPTTKRGRTQDERGLSCISPTIPVLPAAA